MTVRYEEPDASAVMSVLEKLSDQWTVLQTKDLTPRENGAVMKLIYSGAASYKEIHYFSSMNPNRNGLILQYEVTGMRHEDHRPVRLRDQRFTDYITANCSGDAEIVNGGENQTNWTARLTNAGANWKDTIKNDPSQIGVFLDGVLNCFIPESVLPNGLPFGNYGDRPGESRPKQSVKTNRMNSTTITGKVIRACKMVIENPTLSSASIEKACQLSGGTLSRKPHKTTFEKAKQTGIIPRDENGKIVLDGGE